MDPSTSVSAIMHMLLFYKSCLAEAQKKLDKAEELLASQQQVIHQLSTEQSENLSTINRLTNGAGIVCRATDEMYGRAKDLYIDQKIELGEWNEFYRMMLRADIGFAILNGADFVDLTAETEIDSDETESEGEMESE